MELPPNISCIKVGETDDPERVNVVYLVTGARSSAFIDSGWHNDSDVDSIIEVWKKTGSPIISAILVTHRHRDHAGGASKLATATGGGVICSPVEKPFIEETGATVQRTVHDGEIMDLGGVTLEMVHTPGHTMGSLCVFYRDRQIMFTGDTVLGTGTTTINPLSGDMSMFLKSLEKLLTYDVRMIAPGHGPTIDDPEQLIRRVIRRRLEREGQVLGTLKESPSTLGQIFDQMYSGLDPSLRQTAMRQIEAHIVKLEDEGKVTSEGDGENRNYSLIANH